MKLTSFLLFVSFMQVSATLHSQNAKVSIQAKDCLIEQVFEMIERQSNYVFVYNHEQIAKVGKITADFKDRRVSEVLDICLKGSGLLYELQDNTIVIRKSPDETKKELVLVRGRVSSVDSVPIPGVTVKLKGTTLGTATGLDGRFSLELASSPNMVLVFSFIGMKTREIVVKGGDELNVVMEEDAKAIDEVVVTGYQSVRRERMTGSSKTVTAREIEGRGLTSVNEALSSTVSGLNMISSGRPGADSKIQIRGINSINGSTEPMWIVDGMPMQGEIPNIKVGATDLQSTIFTSGIGNITPDDIKSITVLKDAAATAIYGARAANGVIVIETKSGMVGKTRFNFSLNYGIKERPRNNIEMMNTKQKIQFEREVFEDEIAWCFEPSRVMELLRQSAYGVISKEQAEKEIDELSKINTDWFKEIFRTAVTQQYNFSVSGGTEKIQHYTSISYLNEVGTEPNNKYDKLGMSTKITHEPLDAVRITGSMAVTLKNDRSTASIVSPLDYAMYANPYERPYNPDGSYASDITFDPVQSSIRPGLDWDKFNILHDLNNNTNKNRYIDANIQVKLEWEIIKGLMFTSHGVYNVNSNHNRIVEGADTYTNFRNNWYRNYVYEELHHNMVKGSLREATGYSDSYTFKNTLQYTRDIKDAHFISVFFGQEMSERKSSSSYNFSPVYDGLHNIVGFPDMSGISASDVNFASLGDTGKEVSKISSFFANASYSFMDKYILTGALRYDGSDVIGNSNQFTPLWNAALRWNLHRESFMESFGWINLMSLRAGFGYTGSIDKNALPFLVYTLGESIIYDGQSVPTSFQYPNPNIKWQKKQDMNIGLDLSILDYRVELGVNYYNNITRDVLDNKRLASSSGRLEAKTNVADLYNRGIEVDLGITLLNKRNLRWFLNMNVAYNKNTVQNTFYESVDDLPTKITQENGHQFVCDKPAGAWFGYRVAGINPMKGTTLVHKNSSDATYDMSNEFYDIPGDMVSYLGDANPRYVGGFSTSLTVGQFVLSANFEFKAGHKIKSFNTFKDLDSQNRHVNDINRWRSPGDITNIPRLTQMGGLWTFYMLDWMLEEGDYLKCGYLSLGYNFKPEWLKKIGFNSARLSLTAKDLFTLTKYKGIDPLLMGEFGYPNSRKYTATLNIGF